MIKLFISIVLIIFLTGCNNDHTATGSNSKVCVEPQNPYNESSGHYAGFNWAMENNWDCDGNSESFNEGCQEYFQQLDKYDECVKR